MAAAAGTRKMHPDLAKQLFTADDLKACVDRLGRQIGADYAGKHMLMIGVLKGGFIFTADLARAVDPAPAIMEIDFLKASSYLPGQLETSGVVRLDDGFDLSSVAGKHVLVVEDMIDSGLTLSRIVDLLKSSNAASVKVCALLDKRSRRKVVFEADYVGLVCPNEFIVGYGIDYSEYYRFLPYIGVPTEEAVERVAKEVESRHPQKPNYLSDDPSAMA